MTDALFQGIRSENLGERVVKEVVSAIRGGRLQPGKRLPSERELSEQFGVSRVVVREALRSLVATGWVEVRAGRGAYVVESPGTTFHHAWRGWLRQHREEILELLTVRRALEEIAAGQAATNARPPDVAELSAQCDRFEAEAASPMVNVEQLLELDLAFHSLIATSSHGVIVPQLVAELSVPLLESRQVLFAVPGQPAQSAADHRRIVQAIASGDAGAASAAMATHMDNVIRIVAGLMADEATTEGDGQ